jgi:hypothetical protein
LTTSTKRSARSAHPTVRTKLSQLGFYPVPVSSRRFVVSAIRGTIA